METQTTAIQPKVGLLNPLNALNVTASYHKMKSTKSGPMPGVTTSQTTSKAQTNRKPALKKSGYQSRAIQRARCDCGASPTIRHASNWICARCASLENHMMNKSIKPRDRSTKQETPEYRVALKYEFIPSL